MAITSPRILLIAALVSSRTSRNLASAFTPFIRQTASRPFASTSKLSMSAPRVLVPIATGSEEIETTCITDTLTRFGAEVVVASVMPQSSKGTPLVCKMSRGINFLADVHISDCSAGSGNDDWDLIALPGGMPGAEHLRDCPELINLLKQQKSSNKYFAAVCASPAVVLASHNLIANDAISTCYPAPPFREKLSTVSEDSVVVHENMITSKGPGTSLKFALVLGELLFGKEKADEIAKQMLVER